MTHIQRLLSTRKLHKVTSDNLLLITLPFCLKAFFFQFVSSSAVKNSAVLEQAFVETCLTPGIVWRACWGEVKPRCQSEGRQAAHDMGGHTACVFQIL